MIEQAAAMTPSVDHAKELYALVGLIVTQIGLFFANRHTGKKKDREASDDLGRKLRPIHEGIGRVEGKVEEIQLDMREQKVRMESVEGKVDGIEQRERERLERSLGTPDRRAVS